MATIVAVDCTDGVILAGDRLVVRDGAAVGSRSHVFDFDDVGAAAVGDDPDAFRRQLDASIRAYAAEGGSPGIDAVSRMAADAVAEGGVEALVVARDDPGHARARSVTDGVLDEQVAALGSGAPTVLGHLETVGEVDLASAESAVHEAFQAAAARDAGTDEDLDVWRLADDDGEEG